jgi:hypothetical protein
MRNGLRAKFFGWWYYAISLGFLLLAINRWMLGEHWPLIVLRLAISGGFLWLGWFTLGQAKRK